MSENKILVETVELKKYFLKRKIGLKKKYIKALDNVSIKIHKGETLGLVGESGCGKSTLGKAILRIYNPSSGKIIYDGKDITDCNMMPYRRKMQLVFQDPAASLNPRMTVRDIIGEPIDIHRLCGSKSEKNERVEELMHRVGLDTLQGNRYPHEFSGGQQQRIGIARALAIEPEFIICDEPVSALDVSIQSQIVNMLEDMQAELGLTYLFISHDLSVVRHISDRIGVMYLGSIVELTSREELYSNPLHPYTKALLSAIPIPDPVANREKKRIALQGEIPSPLNPPPGCKFHPRCPYATKRCSETAPEMNEVSPGHFCACHIYDK